MSNNKNNKSNNVNTFHEFMPYWSNEEACFKDATIEVNTETRAGRTVVHTRPYPRIKPIEQIVYEGFMSKIKNPVNGEFFAQRTKEGTPVEQPNGQPSAKYIVTGIVRFRRRDNSEWLYSRGVISAWNSLGSPTSMSINAPETWQRTIFDTERKFNPKTNSIEDITKGVTGTETVYEMPWSAENFDRLYAQAVGVNGNKIPGPHNSDIYHPELVVKDEAQGGVPIKVEWSNAEETKRLFRNKDFEFLYNSKYMPDQYKADQRAKSEALVGEKREVPTVTKDSENYKGYTL